MIGKKSVEIELLLGTGKEERSNAPEPTLLPFIAKVAHESSLDFVCTLGEGYARGSYPPHMPWPLLGGTVLSIVSKRLSNLESPHRLYEKHPALQWFRESRIKENSLYTLLSSLETDPWIVAGFDWLHPVFIPDKVRMQGKEWRLELASSAFSNRIDFPYHNFASPIHLKPMGKVYSDFTSEMVSAIEHCTEYNYTPQWLLALAISRLIKITSQDNLQELLDLTSKIEAPWSTNLISLITSSYTDTAYSDVLFTHPGVKQFYNLDRNKRVKLKRILAKQTASILESFQHKLGAAPPREASTGFPEKGEASVTRRLVSTVSNTFRSGPRTISSRPITPPDEIKNLEELLEKEYAPPEEVVTRGGAVLREIPRRVQADVFLKDDRDDASSKLEHAFVAGKKHKVKVWIGFGGVAAASENFPENKVRGDGDFFTLDVAFIVGEEVEWERISLPRKRSRNSTEAEFTLMVHKERSFISPMIVFMQEGRTLQVVQLTGQVVADIASEKASKAKFEITTLAITFGLDGVETQAPFDASIFVGGGKEDKKRKGFYLSLPPLDSSSDSPQGKGFDDLDGMQDRVNEIASMLFRTSDKLDLIGNNLDDETGSELFRDLAIYGREFYTEYVKDRFPELLEKKRIQIITVDPSSYLPLEYIYSGPSPSDRAKLCPEWKNALETGGCVECKLDEEANQNRVSIICPLKFWGLMKVIERHVGKREHMMTYPHWIQADACGEMSSMKPISSALFASSIEVPETSIRKTVNALKRITGKTVTVETWDDWIIAVKECAPNLMVCMPHNAFVGTNEELQLAEGSALRVGDVDFHHLTGSGRAHARSDGPMVVILGCKTAITELHPYLSFIDAFSINGASIVIGMLSTVLAKQAPIIIQEILSLIETGNGCRTLGEALLEVRRRVFAKGLVIGLAVAGFGNTDYMISS